MNADKPPAGKSTAVPRVFRPWRQPHYHSNSGLHNAMPAPTPTPRTQLPHISSTRSLQTLIDGQTSDMMGPKQAPPFTVSYESKQQADLELCKVSTINFQRTHYNPITHVEMRAPGPMTANRLKSVAQFVDKARSFNPHTTQEFVRTASCSARAFHKASGQFSRYNDLCIRSAKLPFEVPASLVTNLQGR